MVGNTASDDPDGLAMYGQMEEERENDSDVFLVMNIESINFSAATAQLPKPAGNSQIN